MTRLEYDLLIADLPGLQLPPYYMLAPSFRSAILHMTREDLIARRAAALLSSDFKPSDYQGPTPIATDPP